MWYHTASIINDEDFFGSSFFPEDPSDDAGGERSDRQPIHCPVEPRQIAPLLAKLTSCWQLPAKSSQRFGRLSNLPPISLQEQWLCLGLSGTIINNSHSKRPAVMVYVLYSRVSWQRSMMIHVSPHVTAVSLDSNHHFLDGVASFPVVTLTGIDQAGNLIFCLI